jgi:hypothetical protein
MISDVNFMKIMASAPVWISIGLTKYDSLEWSMWLIFE